LEDGVESCRNPRRQGEIWSSEITQESRELLLSIDPLVQLGQMQEQLFDRLRQTTPTVQPELQEMWEEAARQSKEAAERFRAPIAQTAPAQFMLLVICDEKQQLALLERFQGEGLAVKALLSSPKGLARSAFACSQAAPFVSSGLVIHLEASRSPHALGIFAAVAERPDASAGRD
jgi:hypothetical protein